MTNFITFEEAIRKEVIKEYDEVIIKSLYPSKNRIEISPQITGDNKIQSFSREEDLRFFFAYDEKGQAYFYGDTTETKLRLRGKTGVAFGVLAVNNACMLYSNIEVGLVARATTEGDIMKFAKSEKGKNILVNCMKEIAWLGSPYIGTHAGYADFGMRYVYYGNVKSYCLYYSDGYTSNGNYGVRSAVAVGLPSKILVDEGKSVNGKWVLIPA